MCEAIKSKTTCAQLQTDILYSMMMDEYEYLQFYSSDC